MKVEVIESILSDDSKVYDTILRIDNKSVVFCCTDKEHADCLASTLEGILEDVVHISID